MGEASQAAIVLVSGYLDDQARRAHTRLDELGPPVLGVAVTTAAEGRPLTAGASDDAAIRVDELQYAIGFGPCLAALSGRGGQYVPDLGSDDRWGEYGPRAAELGAACCLSMPVVAPSAPHNPVAVLKVYSSTVDGLSEAQRASATDFALEVAGGIELAHALTTAAEQLDDRVAAMNARRIIDLALGVVMAREGCNADQAFALLRSTSQQSNVKLRDVAAGLVRSVAGADAGEDRSAPFA